MTILRESLLCRFALWLWAAFRGLWHQSALGGWFHRRRVNFEQAGKTSGVCRFLVKEGAVKRSWGTGKVRVISDFLLNIPVIVLQRLHKRFEAVLSDSILLRALRRLGRGSWAVMGVFAFVMLIAPHEMWNNLYGFLAAVVLFGLYAVGCAEGGKRLEVGRLGPYFTLYLLFITLGLVLSLSVSLSLRFYLFHLTCFFITLVTVSAVETRKQLNAVLVLAACGLAIAAAYGCYQGIIGVEVVASQQDLTLNEGMPGRIYSFFNNPNNFAEVLVMFLPLTAAITMNAKGWRGKTLGCAAFALGLAALLLTYSRSSWLGLALAAVVFLGLLNWRFLPMLLALGVCAIPFLPQSIWNRILTIGNMQDSSAKYRIAIYEDTARLLRDHGLTGVGLGSDVMQKVFHNYPTLYDGNYPIHTHNNYLQMWGETGLFGLVTFLALIFGQIKEGLFAFRRADKELRRIIAAALGGFVGILFIGLVEYTWFYPRNMFLFWLLFAVIACGVKLAEREENG